MTGDPRTVWEGDGLERITVDDAPTPLGLGASVDAIDEIVMRGMTHFEMSSNCAAYMNLVRGDGDGRSRTFMVRFAARATTRAERRRLAYDYQDRFYDHLAALLPQRWTGREPSLWQDDLPWWRKVVAVLTSWAEARDGRRVLLIAWLEDDGEEAP